MQGIIQHATINNLAFGRNVEETLRILQAIQYVQENPDEVPLCSCSSAACATLSVPLPLTPSYSAWLCAALLTAHLLLLGS